MLLEVDTVKGFQDFLPPESLKRRAVKKIIEKYFTLYGFLPAETPIIEFDELMRPEILPGEEEDEAVSDRFRLKDRASRNLGLRYEFTFQLARIFKLNPNIKLPFKRYQIGEVFRDEPVGQGRFRQFTQCDVDIVGNPLIDSDAEILAVVSDILKELKINFEIEVNNRKLLNSIVESIQIIDKKKVIKELDKLSKIGEDEVKMNLKKYADTNQILTLFKLLEKDIQFFKENAFEGAEELIQLSEKCKAYGIKIKFNPFLARGLNYYTGNIFEVKETSKNSIAGGGRYNKLVGKYSDKEIPAVGISFGLERVTELAKVEIETTKAVLISLEKDTETLKLARQLRKKDISCEVMFGKPGKALEFANSMQIPYVIFIGEEEIKKKKLKLKNMKTGEEKLLSEIQIIKALSKYSQGHHKVL